MAQEQKQLNKKILITGGGSGGHISAATAILDGIKAIYPNTLKQVLYVGSNLGMVGEKGSISLEEKLVGATDTPYISIRAGKLQRYMSRDTIKLLFGVFGGIIDSWKVIRSFKPDLIISTGGFVTVPICLVGWLLKIPIYIHEQTAAVGLTNKISARFAKRVYTSFPQSKQFFPKEKVLHVGNAVREKVLQTDGKGEVVDAIKKMINKKATKPIILVTGGGQGSHKINITIRSMLRYLVEEFQIILQTGDNQVYKDYQILKTDWRRLPANLQDSFFPTKYISADEIGFAFANADFHIGRAGANFVYEIGVTRLPSIFIPIPWVTHNEQEKNAQTLVDIGLAKILPEGELSPERLFSEIKKFRQFIKGSRFSVNDAQLKEMFPTDAVPKIIDDLPLD